MTFYTWNERPCKREGNIQIPNQAIAPGDKGRPNTVDDVYTGEVTKPLRIPLKHMALTYRQFIEDNISDVRQTIDCRVT